jgi:glycosyltransferase involved in cell wall biosynthesis
MRVRKIAFVLKWPLSYNGGGENWLKNVILELHNSGHQIDIYLPEFYKVDDEMFNGYPYIRYRHYRSALATLMRKLRLENFSWPFIGFKMEERYDVIYIPSIYAWRFYLGPKGTKRIFGTHDFYHSNWRISRDIFILLFVAFLKILENENIFVHCIDRKIQSNLSFMGVRAILIENSPYAVPSTPIDDGNFNVLFMNVINRRKGYKYLPELMDYFGKVKKGTFLIAGKADDKATEVLIKKENPCTRYLGYVDEKMKKDLLQKASLFLLLSDREAGFPSSMLDSLRNGVPVLSSWNPISEILDEGFLESGAISIVKRSIKDIIEGIERFEGLWFEDRTKYIEMRYSIMENSNSRFDREKQLKKIVRMFEEV